MSNFIEEKKLIGQDPALLKTLRAAEKISGSLEPILIHGESGTGKEILASFIHRLSPRRDGPFFVQNCAAVPEGLIESEFFGYEKGAFTGAQHRRMGIFERTGTGTLFLDEVGCMGSALQKKLLRVLDEMKIRRVGGRKWIPVRPRIIAVSNENLENLVQQGVFRLDLYYRLKVISLTLPPLRERSGDIPLLTYHFLREAENRREGKLTLTEKALQALCAYSWPGNVRQLRNEIARASLLGEGVITEESLSPEIRNVNSGDGKTLLQQLQILEQEEIRKALQRRCGNVTKAAGDLGISRRTLHRRIRQYQISMAHVERKRPGLLRAARLRSR